MPALSDWNTFIKALGSVRQMQADSGSCLADQHCSNRLTRGAVPICSHALTVEMLQNTLYLRDVSRAKVDSSH